MNDKKLVTNTGASVAPKKSNTKCSGFVLEEPWKEWKVLLSEQLPERLFWDLPMQTAITSSMLEERYKVIVDFLEKLYGLIQIGVPLQPVYNGLDFELCRLNVDAAYKALKDENRRKKLLHDYHTFKRNAFFSSFSKIFNEYIIKTYPNILKCGEDAGLTNEDISEEIAKLTSGGYYYSVPVENTNADSKEIRTEVNEGLWISSNNKKFLLLTEEVVELAKKNEALKNTYFSELNSIDALDGCIGQRIGSTLLQKDVYWVKPEEYFLSDTLIIQSSKEAILNDSGYNRASHYVLPLKKEFWECFSRNEDILNLDPSFKEDKGQVTFSINIPIISRGNIYKISVSKVFLENPGNSHKTGRLEYIDFNPLIELWPDFYSEKWKRYFLCNDMVKRFDFTPISRSSLNIRHKAIIGDEVAFHETDMCPDALVCRVKNYDRDDYKEAGIILLKLKQPALNNREWKIGIHIGITKTNIFIKQYNKIKQFAITTLPMQISAASKDALYTGESFFLPNDEPKIPFYNVMKVFTGEQDLHYLMAEYSIHLISAPPSDSRKLKTDITWSDNNNLLKPFLEHLALLVAAEAANDGVEALQFFVAFDFTATMAKKQMYVHQWQRALELMKCYPDATVNKLKNKNAAAGAVAAGRYFTRYLHAPTAHPGAVCIMSNEVESEICIWQDDAIKCLTIVPLSVTTISDCFRKSKGLVRAVFSGLDASCTGDNYEKYANEILARISTADLNSSDKHFSDILDFYVTQYKDAVILRLVNNSNDKYILALQDVIMVAFGAVVYYTGMLIQKMQKAGKIPSKDIAMQLFWGGEASQYLSWLDFGNTKEPKISRMLVRRIMAHFNIRSENFKLSSEPGSEIARGLLEVEDFDNEITYFTPIIGEDILATDGKFIDYFSVLDEVNSRENKFVHFTPLGFNVDDIKSNGSDSKPLFGEEFLNFLQVLNSFRTEELNIGIVNTGLYTDLAAKIESEVGTIWKRNIEFMNDCKSDRAESIFLVQVRVLIHAMINKMDNK